MVNKRDKTQTFIFEANYVHNNKYDYSLVRYVRANEKVIITCRKHGKFEQSPATHLSGYGCKYCGSNRLTRREFFSKVNNIHNHKYKYTRCEYTQDTKKIERLTITCPIHGDFKQRLDLHLQGHGCPTCKNGKGIKYYSI